MPQLTKANTVKFLGRRGGSEIAFALVSLVSLLFVNCNASSRAGEGAMSSNESKAASPEGTSSTVSGKALAEMWQGAIHGANGLDLPLVFHFKHSGALYSGSLDSPAQGMKGMGFDSVSLSADGKLVAVMSKLSARYVGVLDKSKLHISGTWYQGAGQTALNLNAIEKYVGAHRPQEPKPPFPYKVQELSIPSAGNQLAATLTMPPGKGPFPAVVLIHGSGPHDRDETLLEHKPFLLLADYLSRHGVAVLRYDKRGCAKSTGHYKESSSKDFAADALSALQFLKTRSDIDASKIGLLGHSEGGLVAPMVASETPDVHFIVSLAGTALPGDQILMAQVKGLDALHAAPEKGQDESIDIARETYAIIKAEPDNKIAIEKIMEMRKRLKAPEYALPAAAQSVALGQLEESLKLMTGAWYRYFLSFDPREAWSKVHCPVLALNGSRDLQVVATENLPEIKAALKKGGNEDYTEVVFPGLNHLFQTCKTGAPSEYAQIEETMSPVVLSTISDWISKKTGAKS